jgi:hypothetical protein
MHLRAAIKAPFSCYDKILLTHSEKNSPNLHWYENNGVIGVYWWSHATIARDWFRYAEHDPAIDHRNPQTLFLIYNRAWSGTREYRLCFAELLIQLGLTNYCQTSINPIEPELNIHYAQHKFTNLAWQPTHVLEDYFPINNTCSHYSADFDIADYNNTNIEVVLETLFDDSRLHLTEKSLRPIACAQPFILAGTHGSLEYLRSYGFKTFGDIWNEHYDQVKDPKERLLCIADVMQDITNWTPVQQADKLAQEIKSPQQAIKNYNVLTQNCADGVAKALGVSVKGFTKTEALTAAGVGGAVAFLSGPFGIITGPLVAGTLAALDYALDITLPYDVFEKIKEVYKGRWTTAAK